MAEGVVRSPAPPHVRDRRNERRVKLRKLGFASYGDYLRSPHWRELKERYRASELPQVCICGDTDVHLHHMTYERVGAERLTDLTPLCARCHALVHVLEFRGDMSLALDGFCDEGRAIEGRALLYQLAKQEQAAREQRRQEEQREVLALPFAARLLRVARRAKYDRHIDLSSQLRVLRHMTETGATNERMTRRLRAMEELVYGWDGWRDAE